MTAYRDELEAAQSRADALANELKASRAEVARLKSTALVRVGETSSDTIGLNNPTSSKPEEDLYVQNNRAVSLDLHRLLLE